MDASGEWRFARKNHASTAYSALDRITAENVDRLEVAWTFSTGVQRGHEAAPVVVDETMYLVTPWPNRVYALDLTEPGRIRWTHAPEPARAAKGVACCDVVNRGVAYADGRIVFNTLDVHTVALDAETGEQLWKTRLGDFNTGETITMAPLVVGDRVLVGNSGGDLGVRGWIAGLDLGTGEVAWRAYSTGPDDEVLLGDGFEPFYEKDRGEDLGVTTWPQEKWRVGGGNVWGFVSYDPELDLIYHGTANPGPWNALVRPGDNKWTVSVFARDPETGEARWAYQTVPHDEWDHDGINELVLANLEIDGEERRVLVKPERNGYVYLMDRETGEVLSTGEYGPVNVSEGVDPETGELLKNPDISPRQDEWVRDVCPAAPGAKDWQPSAFSPRTGLLYIPRQHLCMDWKAVETNYISGTPWVGVEASFHAGPGGHRGEFQAWDPVAQEEVWSIEEEWPVWSGATVTAGDVAFYGTLEGDLKAVDARTGEELWSFRTGSGIVGQPVTYRGPDGRQYVAVLSGIGGWAGAPVILGTRTPTAAIGFGNATGGLNDVTTLGGTLYVFALPEGGEAARAAAAGPDGHDADVEGERGSASRPGAAGAPDASEAPGAAGVPDGGDPDAADGRIRLRVCADPNNLPFSNDRLEGLENELAALVADELGAEVEYTWRAHRRGFLRNTIGAGRCDVVMGIPASVDRVATTRPYYRSSYALVQRADAEPRVRALGDPALRRLEVGVPLVGDDGANPPPVHALARRGVVENLRGYPVYGDYSEPDPPARLVEAVADGEIDVAVVWGPRAGYFAGRQGVELTVTPVSSPDGDPARRMAFDISMGVAEGDTALLEALDRVIRERRDAISDLLDAFGVPRADVAKPGADALPAAPEGDRGPAGG